MKLTRSSILFVPLLLIIVLLAANLFMGSVNIPVRSVFNILSGNGEEKETWSYIVLFSRLPQAITALFAGAALATAGLMLQTIFSNPLAGPSILGIDAGASLGVALVMLLYGGTIGSFAADFSFSGYIAVVLGAFVGAVAVLGLIIFFSTFVRSNVMLLIIGIMIGYITSSIISLLNFFATAEGVFSYTIWGMGDFSGISMQQLPVFCSTLTVGLVMALLLIKPLNALLLGERYAANLGVNVKQVRIYLLISTGILTAVTTAFCGPIAFIGLAVPHIARLVLGSSNHNLLLPLTLMTGSIVALLCNFISILPGAAGVIPLNAITPVLGAPVILYVIINQKKIQYFN
ncbi:iron ABC transporter permease [Odoribacter sp. OttesenSCG-928-J03]|nr:iron ABC transporter permease [Odoribacter sp. OttesenSCG-928-J03]MDL2283130.1 iron ABC transporter permease [Odoribacter sp. OttesenSCG-928-G04]MDL2330486.1 iron ABC transporter permease [Odoribacter sp. OttesenSCG-928-A06]